MYVASYIPKEGISVVYVDFFKLQNFYVSFMILGDTQIIDSVPHN